MALALHAFAPDLAQPWSPCMPSSDVRFALVLDPERSQPRALPYVTLGALARAIHRARRGAPIQCFDDTELRLGDWGLVSGVAIWTLGESGEPLAYIGWAWISGVGLRALEAALAGLAGAAASHGEGWAA